MSEAGYVEDRIESESDCVTFPEGPCTIFTFGTTAVFKASHAAILAASATFPAICSVHNKSIRQNCIRWGKGQDQLFGASNNNLSKDN